MHKLNVKKKYPTATKKIMMPAFLHKIVGASIQN